MPLLACALLLAVCAPTGRAIVTEVLYDVPGDDTGQEFVELLNPGPLPVALAGVRLEAGDGSAPGRWTLRWTAGVTDTLAPGRRRVIGGARVVPAPDHVVELQLQNGPDAVRLVWPDGGVEVVGWGPHEFAEYACGEPAVDAAAGQSLARIPDDAASGDNRGDFRAAPPSPGTANQRLRDAALPAGRLALAPESPDAWQGATLHATIENRGSASWTAGEAALLVQAPAFTGIRTEPLPPLAAGESLRVMVALDALAPSAGPWVVRVARLGEEAPADDADTLRVRVGPGPVALAEVQFQPAAGEGEWIEVLAAERVDLGGWTLADRGGTRGRVAGGLALAAGERGVLAQDPAALRRQFPALDSTRVRALAPWPSLNNSDDSTGTADALDLRDAAGLPVARLAYSAAGVPRGAPIAWLDGAWRAAEGTGTPLAAPAPFAADAGRVQLARTRALAPGALELAWALPWSRARVTLEVHDLEGRRLVRLAHGLAAPGRDTRVFPLPELPPGLAIVTLTARPEQGEGLVARSVTVRLAAGPR